jgi:hypothetical protein
LIRPPTSELSVHSSFFIERSQERPQGHGKGPGSRPSSGLPLLGFLDRQLQEEEFASPAERKKAATLEKAAAKRVQTAAAKKEEHLRSAALTLAARRSDAESIGRLLMPVV